MAESMAQIDPQAPKAGAVNMWRSRGRIPWQKWGLVSAAAARWGYPEITVKLLNEINSQTKEKKHG